MDALNGFLNAALRGYFALFSAAPPWVSLGVLSAVAGVAMLWVFAKTSNQAAIRATKRKLWAHLLEMRLYGDEPRLVFRAQGGLLKANLKYMALMLQPLVVLALPMVFLLVHLEAYYGRAPLEPGRETILTVGLRSPIDFKAPAPKLEAPEAVIVETPAVRVLGEREISWRIRPRQDVSGILRVLLAGETIEKRIEAGDGFRFVPGRRTASSASAFWHPDEPLLRSSAVGWVDVRYPEREIEFLGLRFHWLIWFTLVSLFAALAFKNRFRVAV
jgi:hypothetical protein